MDLFDVLIILTLIAIEKMNSVTDMINCVSNISPDHKLLTA